MDGCSSSPWRVRRRCWRSRRRASPRSSSNPTGPGAQHGDSKRVPLPPAGPAREAFLAEFITIDLAANEAKLAGQPLSPFEFYQRVNRPDLAARADERTRQRIWLISGAAVVLVAGVTAGAIEFATAPDVNEPSCVTNVYRYNACVSSHQQHQTLGMVLIGGSVAIAASLFTWGMLIPQMVTTPEETVALASAYNRALGKKFGAPGANFHLFPTFAPGSAGLVARLSF